MEGRARDLGTENPCNSPYTSIIQVCFPLSRNSPVTIRSRARARARTRSEGRSAQKGSLRLHLLTRRNVGNEISRSLLSVFLRVPSRSPSPYPSSAYSRFPSDLLLAEEKALGAPSEEIHKSGTRARLLSLPPPPLFPPATRNTTVNVPRTSVSASPVVGRTGNDRRGEEKLSAEKSFLGRGRAVGPKRLSARTAKDACIYRPPRGRARNINPDRRTHFSRRKVGWKMGWISRGRHRGDPLREN